MKSIAAITTFSVLPNLRSFSQSRSNYLKVKPKPQRIFPEKLVRGMRIGLVTPGSPISEEQLKEAVAQLECMGFNTYYEPSVLAQYGYFAGTDRERAEELMSLFKNKEVDAIMCVRGGYGSDRILNLLDFTEIGNNPKIFIGFSDITALLSAIYEKTGLVCFHGPMGVSDFNDFTLHSFENILMKPHNRYKYPYKRKKNTIGDPEFDFYTISEGQAAGELIGGNLSVLVSMIGTKFEPDFENKLVFIEEIDEKTYRVDRMLTQLVEGTNIKKANGIVLGIFYKCNINDKPTLTLRQAVTDILKPLEIPVAYGFPFGHVKLNMTIPVGVNAKFNADKKTLKLTEKAVV